MKAREKKAPPRHKGQEPTSRVPAEKHTFPAPVRGWATDSPLPERQEGVARLLDNWVPTLRGIRVRGGLSESADLTDPVYTLASYRSSVEKLLAATADTIYEVGGSSLKGSLTSGEFSTVQFGTTGGDYLYFVNGSDNAQLYDGTTVTTITGASSPAITGIGTDSLVQVWAFANRLFFVEKDSLSAWYLPVDSIGGAATEFSLAGVFSEGSTLLFGARWSLDAGDGLDDKCVFVTKEGEVAVYEGTNPGSATTWAKVGQYRLPRPLGKRGFVQAGGDLLIATVAGLIPLSSVLDTDAGVIEQKAISLPIGSYWRQQAETLNSRTWDIVKAHDMDVILVSQPAAAGVEASTLMVNMVTGAWARATGWDAQAIAFHGGDTYIAGLNGKVYVVDQNGNDDGALYTVSYLGAFEGLAAVGQLKTARQARPLLELGGPVSLQVGINVDYDETLPSPPSALSGTSGDVWDTGLWDTAVWDAGATLRVSASWVSTPGTGVTIAPYIQASFSDTAKPNVTLASIDLQYHIGAVVA